MIGRLRDAIGWLQLQIDVWARLQAIEHENAEILERLLDHERRLQGLESLAGLGDRADTVIGRVVDIENDVARRDAIAAELYTGPPPAKARAR